MNWIKTILKILLGFAALAVVVLGLVLYTVHRSEVRKSAMVDSLSKIPAGSSVAQVMELSETLGFDPSQQEFAIPSQVEVLDLDVPGTKHDDLPKPVRNKSDLAKFRNGTLNFGLSLFLFSRMGCEISFRDGKVTSARVWQLD